MILDHAAIASASGPADLDGEGARPLPFIGRTIAYRPGESLAVERILDLAEDLHLADHAFVLAQEVKPLSACLPVLPMTLSLEAMAEAAACLAPGYGLVGLGEVEARRWIELADVERLPLLITARHVSYDPSRDLHEIHAAIRPEGQASPAGAAAFYFARRYQLGLSLSFRAFSNPRRHALAGEEIYRERMLFHGPSYQCLSGPILLADSGASCDLEVPSTARMFRSTSRPQFLLNPQALDTLGQLIGVWAMERERYAFPIGIERLELYRPSPPPGARIPVRVEITADSGKTLEADIEVQDGDGAVWMRIKGWRMWKFRWDRRLVAFRRAPANSSLSEAYPLEAFAGACQAIEDVNVSDFDLALLARHYLHEQEMPAFSQKADVPRRRRQWLLGRIAAKDAARAWLARENPGAAGVHPAALLISQDASRQPVLLDPAHPERRLPKISIAHCDARAIAVAHEGPVGVDIEPVSSRDAAFSEMACGPGERALLEKARQASGGTLDEWVTRLWCAKEAFGKRSGTGLGNPRRVEAVAISDDGSIELAPGNREDVTGVTTRRDGDFIIAWV